MRIIGEREAPHLDMTLRCAGKRVDHDRKNIWQWQVCRVWRTLRRCLILKVDLIEKDGVSKETGQNSERDRRDERGGAGRVV